MCLRGGLHETPPTLKLLNHLSNLFAPRSFAYGGGWCRVGGFGYAWATAIHAQKTDQNPNVINNEGTGVCQFRLALPSFVTGAADIQLVPLLCPAIKCQAL